VYLTDPWADTDIKHGSDSSSTETGNNVYGAIGVLHELKTRNRNLKTMLSIGGWTYTNTERSMDVPLATVEGRRNFAESCVDMIKEYGFDGVDIDWEVSFPSLPCPLFLCF
jgi:chitinase